MPIESPSIVRVLLVEDEPLVRFVGRRNLEDLGFHVFEAETCSRAIEWLETSHFDAIVLDHRLPDGFGIDVVRELRKKGHRISVIYVSAEADQITREIQDDLKIDALLVKPVGTEDLKQAMKHILLHDGEEVAWECEASRDEPTFCGRFMVLAGPQNLSAQDVRNFQVSASDHPWLGLDLRSTEGIEEEAVSELIQLAGQCRQGGGRLGLIGLRADLDCQLRAKRLDRECDLLLTLKGLESIGRRLSAMCERVSLLDSSITRNQNDQNP